MSAIYILWLRAIKRYVRSKPRMIAALGQPLLFLIALGFGFGPISSAPDKATTFNSSRPASSP